MANRRIVVVVERRVGKADRGTGGRPLLDARCHVPGVTQELLLKNEIPHAADVLGTVLSLPRQRAGELRVEQGQSTFHAAEGIGLGDRRVVDCGRGRWRREQRDRGFSGLWAGTAEALEPSSQVAEHFAVCKRRADRLLQRQFPDLVEPGVGKHERLGRARRLVERCLTAVGIFKLLNRADIMRQVAVLKEVERLPGRTAPGQERDARDGYPELAGESGHGRLSQGRFPVTHQIAAAAPKG